MRYLLFVLCLWFTVTGAQAQGKFDVHQLLSDIKTLSSDAYQGRRTGTAGSKKAQEYIIARFLDYKLIPFEGYYEQPFSFKTSNGMEFNGTNLIGYIEGKVEKDLYLVVTAHYDHLGIRGNQIFNGADDNASGVAAMFAVAEYFQRNPPDHSIIFVATDAEEIGLKGAYHFVDKPPVPLEQIVMNINVDMISRNESNEIFACGVYHFPFLKTFIEKNKTLYDIKLRYGHDEPESQSGMQDWSYASDHGPFLKKGIPFIYFGVEDHDDYHKPTDTFDKINQVFFVKAASMVLDYIDIFDKNLKAINAARTKLK
jgi:Zn-dependent M28 family amino/carboxypeptidase